MGYSLSWAAIKNGSLDTIRSAGQLRPTSEREQVPESSIVSAEIPSGWQLVLYNRSQIDDEVLSKLSANDEVVYCSVEDHVMHSSASGWLGGKRIWRVFHDCEKGRYHLGTAGNPPTILSDIQERLIKQQDSAGGEKADVDFIYDIPIELAKALTSFRHDQDVQGMSGDIYHVLEPSEEAKGLVGRLVSTCPADRALQLRCSSAFFCLLCCLLRHSSLFRLLGFRN